MWTLLRAALASLLVVLLLLPGGVAQAHDELIGTEPGDGDTVPAPEELVLTFSGQISQLGAQVVVTDEDDVDVVDGELMVEGAELVVPLADELSAGDYQVGWRVTSEDGHPISGTFEFTVEAAEDESAVADGEATGDAAATDDATEEVTQDANKDTTDEATEEANEEATTDATDPAEETASDESATGVPVWVWVVGGLLALGLIALLVHTWNRGRGAE